MKSRQQNRHYIYIYISCPEIDHVFYPAEKRLEIGELDENPEKKNEMA